MTASKPTSTGDGADSLGPKDNGPGEGPPYPSIHFGGAWTSDEKDLVRQAIRAFEQARTSGRHPKVGATWVCAAVHEGTSAYYFASRHGLRRVLKGATPQILADAITRFGHSA